jgi:hypothetical protein
MNQDVLPCRASRRRISNPISYRVFSAVRAIGCADGASSAIDDIQYARWGDESFEGSRRGAVDVYAWRACLLVVVDVSAIGWSVDEVASSGCVASRPVENSKQESGCSDDHQRNPPVAA